MIYLYICFLILGVVGIYLLITVVQPAPHLIIMPIIFFAGGALYLWNHYFNKSKKDKS